VRAIDLVMFLVCLNAGFYIVDAIGVYGAAAPAGRILSLKIVIAGVEIPGAAIVAGLAGAVAAASFTILGSQVTKPIGIVVIAFACLYTFLLADAMAIIGEIQLGGIGVTVALLLAMGTLNIIAFLVGVLEMVSGGMRAAR